MHDWPIIRVLQESYVASFAKRYSESGRESKHLAYPRRVSKIVLIKIHKWLR